MKKKLLLVFLAASLILSGCGPKVAATVDGKKIFENDVSRRFDIIKLQQTEATLTGKTAAEPSKEEDAKLRQDILANLIDEAVLLNYAQRERISAPQEEVTARIDEIKKSLGSEEAFLSKLKESGLTVEFLSEEIRKSFIFDRLFSKVTEGFELTDEVFAAAIQEAHTKHILVSNEKTAGEVLAKLKGGGDFAALAKEYSKDPGSADMGGDIGWSSRYGLVKEYGDVAFSQELGVISEPVQSKFGWHIIVTLAKRAPTLTKEEKDSTRSAVAEAKKGEKFEVWLEELKKKADIKIND